MEFRDLVYQRRSVRKFQDKTIEKEILKDILDAALWAPSSVNLQPWYFVAITSPEERNCFKEIMHEVSERNRAHLEERFSAHPEIVKSTLTFLKTLGNAPVVILAFRDKADYSWATMDESIVQSIAASMENLILSAWDKGIASCWMTAPLHAHMQQTIRDKYAPGHGDLVSMVVLGYAEENCIPRAPKRKTEKYTII